MLSAVPLLIVAFAAILFASELFTNGIEWVGVRLGLGHGAVGSVLAAIGTGMPETAIPVIAILVVGNANSQDVGVGAILGAPFLLGTMALTLTGMGLFTYQKRRTDGTKLDVAPHHIQRDLTFFCAAFGTLILASLLPAGARYAVAAGLLATYAFYVFKAITESGEADKEDDLNPLRLTRYLGMSS